MQSKEKLPVDARSFPQIWAALNSDERDDLTNSFFQAKCCLSRQAVFYWASGQKKPRNRLVRDTVSKIVGKAIGAKVIPATLFPI